MALCQLLKQLSFVLQQNFLSLHYKHDELLKYVHIIRVFLPLNMYHNLYDAPALHMYIYVVLTSLLLDQNADGLLMADHIQHKILNDRTHVDLSFLIFLNTYLLILFFGMHSGYCDLLDLHNYNLYFSIGIEYNSPAIVENPEFQSYTLNEYILFEPEIKKKSIKVDSIPSFLLLEFKYPK